MCLGSRIAWLGLALLASCGVMAVDIGALRSPRPDGWVVDPDGRIDAATRLELNQLGNAAYAHNRAGLFVVVVASTGGMAQRAFATELLNRWSPAVDAPLPGVLILVAVDDRAAELVLSDRIGDAASQQRAEQIMRTRMVPAFRAGNLAQGLLAGARAAAQELLGLPHASADLDVERPREAVPSTPPVSHPLAPTRASERVQHPKSDTQRYWPIIGGAGVGLLAISALLLRPLLRYRPRRCRRCHASMLRLDEVADDASLDASERCEERLGSVDYDVWRCTACSHVEKLRYGALLSRYSACPRCRARTQSSSRTTLQAATYDHGGRVRVDEVCAHCGYTASREYTTARKTRTSSNGMSTGVGGGAGRAGGYRSSGRGASGRW